MSWGYEKTGTPDAISKDVALYFERAIHNYGGKPEADDLAACKARILALVGALDMTTGGANAVTVKASGSHSWTDKGVMSANFSVSVTRTMLAL